MANTLRILHYLKPYWRRVIVVYVCLFSALALQLTIPTILARAIDDGIIARDPGFLTRAALLIIGLVLLQGIFTYVRSFFVESISFEVAFDMRNELYVHLQRLSFSFHDQAQTGQLMSRGTEDINNIRSMLVMAMRPLVMAIGTLIAVTVILLRIDLGLAALALLPMPFLIWYSIRFGVSLRPMFVKVQQQFGTMTSALQENVAGNRVVRAFAQERAESERFEAELEELFDRNLRAARRWAFSYPLTLLVSGIGLAVVVWFGALQVIAGVISIGTLVAFNRYITLLNDPIRWLGMIVNRIARAVASAERLFETLDSRPTIKDRPGAVALPPIRGEVRFDDVRFAFPGTKRNALEGISFSAPAGSVTALIGGTGSGKSALLSLIPRFYDVSAGRVLVDGQDAREVTLDSLRRQIGIVLQETFLFSITIRENIAFGRPEATLDEIVAAATAARAHEFITAMPEGYETKMGERGVTLSGGQKQRLA
ncbi:MAG: ABC transporter ATP-binding protein/permease, partial [Chloroflexota bacterium]|nr:ABC transporter ATP-binding protein/permease [Chloroflexota bacterium]